jgi:hypothetical protein
MRFTLWGTDYRIRFSYTRNAAGHRTDTYAWLEAYNPVFENSEPWMQVGLAKGAAYLRFRAANELNADRERTIAQLPSNLAPVLRKQAIRAIKRFYNSEPFSAESGRKLALARALEFAGWCKHDRREVWQSYLSRPRPTAAEQAANGSRKQAARAWDAHMEQVRQYEGAMLTQDWP